MDRKTNAGLWPLSRMALGLISVALFGLMAVPLNAQVAGARIAGTVTDSTGAVIVGAQVTIENMADGFTRDLVTNRSGFYSTPNLSPGPYSVTASAKGFKSEVRSGITLMVGADVEINLTMTIGNTSESIDVRGEPPAIETNDATLGAVVERPDGS